MFHDVLATWVCTDVVSGHPKTDFLIRMGIDKDVNAAVYFPNQCKHNWCRIALKTLIDAYNKLFDLNILTKIRLNITASDETSTIERKMLSREKWLSMVLIMHTSGRGRSFSQTI